jgi:hypothetical protein
VFLNNPSPCIDYPLWEYTQPVYMNVCEFITSINSHIFICDFVYILMLTLFCWSKVQYMKKWHWFRQSCSGSCSVLTVAAASCKESCTAHWPYTAWMQYKVSLLNRCVYDAVYIADKMNNDQRNYVSIKYCATALSFRYLNFVHPEFIRSTELPMIASPIYLCVCELIGPPPPSAPLYCTR